MGRIQVTNLGKAYKQYPGRWSRLAEWLTPGDSVRHQLKWVLQDISFNVEPGESVGIIGINGAGKSTLLKLITGTTQPTTGQVSISGRVAALLELGMGFHPDFTGRQNAIMAGQLLGMTSQEVTGLMPHIEAFAEIGEYIDSPVRVYSSGMQMRLAFSVATALRPDVLIVDEALSVGDAYFQHKCFDRVRSYRAQGTTLLFVSHDPGAVKTLCDRAILINKGSILFDGKPADVLDYYNALIAPDAIDTAIREGTPTGNGTRSGSGAVRILEVDLLTESKSMRALVAGQPASISLRLQAAQPLEDFTIGLLIKDRLGNDVFGTNTHHMLQTLGPIAAGEIKDLFFNFPSLALGPGHYSITLAAHASADHLAGNYDWWERALVFQVMPAQGIHTIGLCHMPLTCHQQSVHAAKK
jgi:lipopolysaccharide transport system ATP-binding protein